MFEYLTQYGVGRQSIQIEDFDITDRLAQQERINEARRKLAETLQLQDEIFGKQAEANRKLNERKKELIIAAAGSRVYFDADDTYVELVTELEALKSGSYMVKSQIDFYQSDLSILKSMLYSK